MCFRKTQDGAPQTLVELQKQALIKLVTTDGKDPDNIGFQRWRNAFYVAGETAALLFFIYLLDEFWLHASEAIQGDLMVARYPHCGVDIVFFFDLVAFVHVVHGPFCPGGPGTRWPGGPGTRRTRRTN